MLRGHAPDANALIYALSRGRCALHDCYVTAVQVRRGALAATAAGGARAAATDAADTSAATREALKDIAR